MTPEQHRNMNTYILTVVSILFLLMIGLNMYLTNKNTHTLEDCESMLFQKLTSQKAPTQKELHEPHKR